MRHHLIRLLACGLIVAGSQTTAPAQEGLRGPGGSIGGFELIAVPAVQQELRMDQAQSARAQEVANRMKARYGQDVAKLKGLNRDEQLKRAPTLAAPHYEEGMRQLRAFLKPAQVDRFDQILFQLRGPMAILEPKIAETLQITNEQAQKVAQIAAQTTNDQQATLKEAGGPTKEATAKLDAIAADANAKANQLLSPEQQRTWARIMGKPFRPGSGPTGPADGQSSAQP